jgi:hypothetical protein
MVDIGTTQTELAVHRARVCQALRESRDPLLREIGEQLERGAIVPRDLLIEPSYRQVVDNGLDRLARFDPDDPATPAQRAPR